MPDPYRRDYNDEEFVGRRDEIAKIVTWAKEHKKRVLTVTGPPGIGKTWLLKQAFSLLKTSPRNNVLWIDVPRPENIGKWLKKLLKRVSIDYPEAPPYDPIPQPGVLLQEMATILCQNNTAFYFVFDKGDELFRDDDQDDWHTVEKIIINPLARLDCIHFIIALHDDQRIGTSILRRSSAHLPLKNFQKEQTALDHIRRLLPHAVHPLPGITAEQVYQDYLPGYKWQHPGLNAFLICECLTLEDDALAPNFGHPPSISEVLEALLNKLPPDAPTTIDLLTQIAHHTQDQNLPFWTPVVLENIANLSTSEAWNQIDIWQEYHLIVDADVGFNIQKGLYELLTAVSAYNG